MASTVGTLIQQLFGETGFDIQSSAMTFQYKIVSLIFGVFTILSTFPLIFKDHIQCMCDPGNIWKDVLETACLLGNMTSTFVSEDLKTLVTVQHTGYHQMPFLFIWMMVLNLAPALLWKQCDGYAIDNLTADMRNFNPMEDGARALRLHWYLKENLRSVVKSYVALFIGDLCGSLAYIYQCYIWNSSVNSVIWAIFESSVSWENTHSVLFPSTVNCSVSKSAPGGQVDEEDFRCFLTMNGTYEAMMEFVTLAYCIAFFLQIHSLVLHLLPLTTAYRM